MVAFFFWMAKLASWENCHSISKPLLRTQGLGDWLALWIPPKKTLLHSKHLFLGGVNVMCTRYILSFASMPQVPDSSLVSIILSLPLAITGLPRQKIHCQFSVLLPLISCFEIDLHAFKTKRASISFIILVTSECIQLLSRSRHSLLITDVQKLEQFPLIITLPVNGSLSVHLPPPTQI